MEAAFLELAEGQEKVDEGCVLPTKELDEAKGEGAGLGEGDGIVA